VAGKGRGRPIADAIKEAAGRPLGAAILGGLIVLVAAGIAVEAGWVGKEEKTTVVQSSLGQASAQRVTGDGLTVSEIYEKDAPGVVFIRADVVQEVQSPFGFPQRQRGIATGSGFVIDSEGYILTNAHVVQGASDIQVQFSDKKDFRARLVGQDASNDVALLKVDAPKEELSPIPLGDSSKVHVGDPVVAIGNPFGLDRTVTTGIISALQRKLEAPNGFTISDVIQTDAAINPGNSGGPLIDANGRVIGINSQIQTAGGGGNIGIGFAVPIDKAEEIAAKLKKEGKVRHALLGVSGITIDSSLSDKLNLPASKGVLVQVVSGPAEKAGIRAGDTQITIDGQDIMLGGDVITELDGQAIDSMDEVVKLVERKKPGDEVTLKVIRGANSRTVKVKLGERPQNLAAGGGELSPPQGLGP
jgi:S1-C subfamily serine protease